MFDLKGILDPVVAIINKVIPDKTAAAAAAAQLQSLALQGQLQEELTQLTATTSAQSDINKVEAANSSTFVAGWRPMIGWVCAVALGSQYILRPVIQWAFTVSGHALPSLPGIDDNLWQLMFGMLGMGGLRTFEKLKGVAAK